MLAACTREEAAMRAPRAKHWCAPWTTTGRRCCKSCWPTNPSTTTWTPASACFCSGCRRGGARGVVRLRGVRAACDDARASLQMRLLRPRGAGAPCHIRRAPPPRLASFLADVDEHKRLAARFRLGSWAMATRARPYALHWLEEWTKRQCAPGGQGRKRDRDEFQADFLGCP